MDKLKELIDQIKDTFLARWEQFQETEAYASIKERYDNLSPTGQKLSIAVTISIIALILVMIPLGWYRTSSENITMFEDTKQTINELLEVSQESKTIPAQAQNVTGMEVRSRIDRVLAEKGLTKEQIASIQEKAFTNPAGSNLIPSSITQNGIEVSLKKLNLRQIVDIGYEFDRISPTVKVLGVNVTATAEDVHYYDTIYNVASFSVPEVQDSNTQQQRK